MSFVRNVHALFRDCHVLKTQLSLLSTTSVVCGAGTEGKGPTKYPLKNIRVFNADKRSHFNEFFIPRYIRPDNKTMNKRQERVKTDQEIRHGKEVIPRRSEYIDWNYDAELAALQARLGERFDDAKLRQSFVTLSYMESEYLKKKELGVVDTAVKNEDDDVYVKPHENALVLTSDELAEIRNLSQVQMLEEGSEFIADTLAGFLRAVLPRVPEEGVEAIVKHLTSDKVLAHVGFHVGIKDLILCKEYPPSVTTMSDTFKALMCALRQSPENGEKRAERLILDIVATQLDGKDINDIWDIENPMGIVSQVLERHGMPKPESRLLWVTGENTIMACYHVGIYCDKELVGKAPGESVEIAEDLAAREVIRNMFGYEDSSRALPFGKDVESLTLQRDEKSYLDEWKTAEKQLL